MFLKIDFGLTLLALALAFAFPGLGSRCFEFVENKFGSLARKKALSVLVVGLAALALRAAVLPILPIPQPLMQDEFSYLLGAETFAHGRLTNPTPPMWQHFESQMILMQPTYASKYPPGQSAFLAVGQVLFGHPFWGVWLSLGLMCGAICWMLQAWVGEEWALLGGFLAVGRISVFSFWANSYWGGAVAALGGALVLGALPRIKQEHRVRNAVLMGIGLAILANSRPYEGLAFSLPVALALFAWMLGKRRPSFSISLRRVVLPLCLVLGFAAVAMGYYNWRVTGKPLRLPYQAYQAQYDPTPYFLWQSQKPLPKYRHAEMKQWEEDVDLRMFRDAQSPVGLSLNELEKAESMWLFYVGPMFTLVILLAFLTQPYGFSWRSVGSDTKFLLFALAAPLGAVALEAYFYPQYAAPMTCLFFVLVLLAMRHLRSWQWRGRPTGLFLVRSVPVVTIMLLTLSGCASPLSLKPSKLGVLTPWVPYQYRFPGGGRGHILSELRDKPGRQIVFVRYSRGLYKLTLHEKQNWPPVGVWEWVYNRPDINREKVVWAQDMSPAQNEQLIHYFGNAHAWLLYADHQPPELVPYAAAIGSPIRQASAGVNMGSTSSSARASSQTRGDSLKPPPRHSEAR